MSVTHLVRSRKRGCHRSTGSSTIGRVTSARFPPESRSPALVAVIGTSSAVVRNYGASDLHGCLTLALGLFPIPFRPLPLDEAIDKHRAAFLTKSECFDLRADR